LRIDAAAQPLREIVQHLSAQRRDRGEVDAGVDGVGVMAVLGGDAPV